MLRLLILLVFLLLLVNVPNCSGGDEGEVDDSVGALAGRSVLVVVADSLHAGHLSAYGYERATSPFVERLATQGVRADRALSQTSWTLSSVTSLFTGVVQEVHGVRYIDQQLPSDGQATMAELFRRKGYRTVGIVQNAVVAPRTGLGRGFDRYEYMRFTEAGSENIVAAVAEEIEAAEDGPPVFLYVHFGPPHMPYQPPEPFLSRFAGGAPESKIVGSIRDTGEITIAGLSPDDPDVLRLVELYDGHIAYADDLLRRVAEPLLAPDRRERFAVLFTSDHGEAFMQHGAVGHNYFCYEPMVRIPWVLAAPGALPEGVVLPGPTSILDTLPTLAQLFDLALPGTDLDGTSLVPSFTGPASMGERELYLSSRYPAEGKAAQFALVQGTWKIVVRRHGKPPALFDVSNDPEELNDLAALHPERVARMARDLEERRAAYARVGRSAESTPLSETVLRDLEALGYGGEGR